MNHTSSPLRVTAGPADYPLACLLPVVGWLFWRCRQAADRLDLSRLNRAAGRNREGGRR